MDAYPNDVFEGSVTQVRQEATTTSNVVTYEVVISAPNDDLKLKPGLTANVTILTQEKENVIYVPNKALRFVPTQVMLEKEAQIKDCEGKNKVWVKEGKNLKAIPVEIGMTNGSFTEITKGVSVGTEVVTDVASGVFVNEGPSNPFMPGPPGSRNNNNKK
ncbi:MAG: efflux RND transporter periplasmic adaptor subunit [Bacteroidaceae bacterium]|nr:efflux RND transporter periplasmic adaptor subunit [Bacteroidaceae bacterium]